MTVFYYDKEKALNGILFCLGQEEKVLTQEEIQEQGKEELYSNSVYYEGEYVLVGHPIIEGDKVRAATDREIIELGLYELQEGEILDGDNVITLDRPGWQYKWYNNEWVIDENVLNDGEIVVDNKVFYTPPSEDLYDPVWNKEEKIWEEGSECVPKYYAHIDALKEQILSDGFIFVDNSGFSHRQKTRLTDKINLEIVINSLYDDTSTEIWYFDVNDTPALTLSELKKMKNDGIIFNRVVFSVENALKKIKPDKKIDIEYFKNEVDKVSSVKCYRV